MTTRTPRLGRRMKRSPFGRAVIAVGHRFEAAAAFLALMTFRSLGLRRASALGGFLGRRLGPLLPPHRLAAANLEAAMPELNAGARAAILEAMWDNLGRTAAEYAHIGALNREGRVSMVGAAPYLAMQDEGRPILFFSAHLANYEMMALALTQAGFRGGAVYRAANNPIVNRWLIETRKTHCGPMHFPKGHEGVRELVRLMKAGKAVYMLLDQRLREGVLAPFFGRPALTSTAPAVFQRRFGAVLAPARLYRLPGPRFEMRLDPPLEIAPDADDTAIAAQINAKLEEIIREAPELWLWAHDRWKLGRAAAEAEGVQPGIGPTTEPGSSRS